MSKTVSEVLASDLQPVCHWTNVLVLFIGLVHSKSSRLVDGPLALMGNSIIPSGPVDWQTEPSCHWSAASSRATLMQASIQRFICLWNIDIGFLSPRGQMRILERAFRDAGNESSVLSFFFVCRIYLSVVSPKYNLEAFASNEKANIAFRRSTVSHHNVSFYTCLETPK